MRVNEGISLPMHDFAIPGNVITKKIESDHIFSKKKFVTLEGFDKKRSNLRKETSEHDR
ncbi:hypothetical protein [Streptococcus infantis]|uniref:hypothetical protein n=1 Tax=Streptococcus infantis TaxID=68892 RepID=UPI0039C0C7CE